MEKELKKLTQTGEGKEAQTSPQYLNGAMSKPGKTAESPKEFVTVIREAGNDSSMAVRTKADDRGILRLWCDQDQSFECIHAQYAWTIPQVQEGVQEAYYNMAAGRSMAVKLE
ncbi:MAG: hypothetical protein B2I17_10070 [Thermoplasmatales archaeon B_DKE]|nr:MAG: hypothetical protein B2I17_10070 [Thermoplasmatales archaeon B_DKE]